MECAGYQPGAHSAQPLSVIMEERRVFLRNRACAILERVRRSSCVASSYGVFTPSSGGSVSASPGARSCFASLELPMVDATQFLNLAHTDFSLQKRPRVARAIFSKGKIRSLRGADGDRIHADCCSIRCRQSPITSMASRACMSSRRSTAIRSSRYYEIDWQVIPNLIMDLIMPVLERMMNVYLAGQVMRS